MNTPRELLAKVRAWFTGRRLDGRLGEEIEAHLALLSQDYARAGLSPDEAHQAARRAFGGVMQITEAHRDARRLPVIDTISQDLRHGLRMLRRSPAFAGTAIVTLALGIGANTAIFSLLDAVVLRALPVAKPHELFVLSGNYSYASFSTLRARSRSTIDVFATKTPDRLQVASGEASTEVSPVSFVSGSYFSVLGVPAFLGRTFGADDDREIGAPAVAVVNYGYWQRRFGADRGLVGRTIRVTGVPLTVIGIAPPGFFGDRVGATPDLWIPLTMYSALTPDRDLLRSPTTAWLDLVGRLRPGNSPESVGAMLTPIYRQALIDAFGGQLPDEERAEIERTTIVLEAADKGLSSLRGRFSRPLWMLMTVVGLVLLIACANVASLLLARATARRREMGLRLALGVSRGRLLRQLLTEALLLSSIGASLGTLLAWPLREVLLRMVSADGSRLPLAVATDLRTLVFVAAGSVLTALLFGLAPAWKSTRVDLVTALGTARGSDHRWRGATPGSVVVVGQIAVSLVLVLGAALFLRSLSNLRHVDLGFEPEHRVIVDVNPGARGYRGARYAALNRRLLERLEALPGVSSVTLSENGALMGRESSTDHLKPPEFVPGAPASVWRRGAISRRGMTPPRRESSS